MKVSRDFALFFHFIFDQCIPPFLRDSKWFMWLPFRILFKEKSNIFFDFKEKAPYLSKEQFCEVYREAASVFISRDTDLNKASIIAIEDNVLGETVLDIACGRGFLSKKLSANYQVTAVDIVIDPSLFIEFPSIKYLEANLESLPFDDQQFDTVICAHTLEHVQDIQAAIHELRRVTSKRLIVIVPKQRPYKYTFDLHIHFFPYANNLLTTMTGSQERICRTVGRDWFYIEDRR